MSLVCKKCRRLVRDKYIFIDTKEYYCLKCGIQYKLSAEYINNYFHRYSSPIHSKILIDKSDNIYTIKIPNGEDNSHAIVSVLFVFFSLLLAYSLFIGGFLLLSIVFLLLVVFLLIATLFLIFGSVFISLSPKFVSVKRTLFGVSHTKRKPLKELQSIFIFLIGKNIEGIKLDFGNTFTGIGFGIDLTDEERNWLLKELRYMKLDLKRKIP